jgi:hypothetical protein
VPKNKKKLETKLETPDPTNTTTTSDVHENEANNRINTQLYLQKQAYGQRCTYSTSQSVDEKKISRDESESQDFEPKKSTALSKRKMITITMHVCLIQNEYDPMIYRDKLCSVALLCSQTFEQQRKKKKPG